MKVLLIVDLQNDFCPGGNLAVQDGDAVVPVVNSLMQRGDFDLVIASKDWHPNNHVSFAGNHPGKNVFDTVVVHDMAQTLWPAHCVQDSSGAELHPKLTVGGIDKIILKGCSAGIDSYSAFFDNGHLQSTGLTEYLQEVAAERGITLKDISLSVCGLATDYCVKFSALDAATLGIKTEVVYDACRAVNAVAGDEEKALKELIDAGVSIVQSKEILKAKDPGVCKRSGTTIAHDHGISV